MDNNFVSVRTDLALEAREYYTEKNKSDVPGVKVQEYSDGRVKVSRVEVTNDEGERIIGKPKGFYITLEFPEFVHYDGESIDEVSKILAKELSPLVKLESSMTALVVGLGNWNITPDAVGPKVVSKIMVTRHLKEYVPDTLDEGVSPVCAIAPGVLGNGRSYQRYSRKN